MSFALPVVVERSAPLIFRRWHIGATLKRDASGLPAPPEGEEITPDIVVAPVVGFDRAAYRLGYGGGYYDRTLGAISGTPLLIGVGYSRAAIPTIYPQPHDIPMDIIVTEQGIAAKRIGSKFR